MAPPDPGGWFGAWVFRAISQKHFLFEIAQQFGHAVGRDEQFAQKRNQNFPMGVQPRLQCLQIVFHYHSPCADKPLKGEHWPTPNVSFDDEFFCQKEWIMPNTVRPPRWRPQSDPRDRLIIALFAQLEAERQTRETLRSAIRSGAIDPAVLEAIADDPVPATSEDIAALERTIAMREGVRSKGEQQGEYWR